MTKLKFASITVLPAIALGFAVFIAGSPMRGISDDEQGLQSRIRQGFAHAPLPLNLKGKSRGLVGLGSYLVNVAGDCNGCHTSDPNGNQWLPDGNPFMGAAEKIDPAKYLVGGRVFIPAHGQFPAVFSRNLRPEANGLPEGHTFAEFLLIMRTGIDLDQAHPQYGPLLQVMPWPAFRNLTDEDIRAIYEYLSALPPVPNP
jgi:hypothetical protein